MNLFDDLDIDSITVCWYLFNLKENYEFNDLMNVTCEQSHR